MSVRTRLAPSPTGSIHIATMRNALYCFALARKNQGRFIVRIEDTDQNRFVEGATEEIFSMLKEYHMEPDESLMHGGDYGPYLQSERKDLYLEYAEKLLLADNAYYCFLEGEELETMQAEYRGKGFRSPYRFSTKEEIETLMNAGKPYTIRLKVPENRTIEYEDGIQGKIKFDSNLVGDEVLIKSNGMASYHLAVVVDDYLMRISHVIRSIEWLPSTPKQILIYEFLGLQMPPYYHPPVILDPEGGKLSKRKGTVSAKEFLKEGYVAEALLNFIMLLGWAAPIKREHGEKEREIFSLAEFTELFDLNDINKSNPIFNRQKLVWFNKEYIKTMSIEDIQSKFVKWLDTYAADHVIKEFAFADPSLDKKLALIKERAATLVEIADSLAFFYTAPTEIDWNIKQLENVGEKLHDVKSKVTDTMNSLSEDSTQWTHEEWETKMRAIGDEFGVKHGDVFMVLRLAIVGAPFSPPLFEALQILGKEEVMRRLNGS